MAADSRISSNERLFEAVRRNDQAAVAAALSAGARADALDEWGLTAADVALDKGYFPIARYLMDLRKGAVTMPIPAPAAPPPPAAMRPPPSPPAPPPVVAAPEPVKTIAAPAPAVEPSPPPAEPPPAPATMAGFLDRLQSDLRRLLAMDTSAKGPVQEAEPEKAPEPAEVPPREEVAALPESKAEVASREAPPAPPPPAVPVPAVSTPKLLVPPPDFPRKVELPEPTFGKEPAPVPSAPVAESRPQLVETPSPEVQPAAQEPGFFDRLGAELRKLVQRVEKPPTREPEVATEGWEPKTSLDKRTEMAALPAPKEPMPPTPAVEPPPPEPAKDAWAPKTTVQPEAPPEPSPPPPPKVEAETKVTPGFFERLGTQLQRLVGPTEGPAVPATGEKDAWAPKTSVEGAPQVAALPEPKPPAEAPKPAEEKGFLSRLLSALKSEPGAEKPREAQPGMMAVPAKPEPGRGPSADDLAALPPGEAKPAAPAASASGGKVPASLQRLGIPDIGKYLSDEPYRPGKEKETETAAALPPAGAVPRDPFSPGLPVAGGVPGMAPLPGQAFDPRFERGETRPRGGLADALAPLDEGGAPPASTQPKQGNGIFDRLGEFMKPPDRPPERRAPPPSGADEPAPESGNAAREKAIQMAKLTPGDARNLPLPEGEGKMLSVPLTMDGAQLLGKAIRPAEPYTASGYGKSCVSKERETVVFCVEPIAWTSPIAPYFDVSTMLYQGFQSVVRYDDGVATSFHTLFRGDAFGAVVAYYTGRFGAPTDAWVRRISPLGSNGQDNPSVAWRSKDPQTGKVTILEIRAFDDARGGFPDMRHGAVMLRHANSKPIFPRLSILDLMVMKPTGLGVSTIPVETAKPSE